MLVLQFSSSVLWGVSFVVVLAALQSIRKLLRKRQGSIGVLPGPPPGSWFVGNEADFQRAKVVGDAEFKWIEDYGTALRIKGPFGEDIMYLADPKAFNYILTTGGYNFYKPDGVLGLLEVFVGKGLLAVEGTNHARHRKIMNPAFSYTSLKGFLPIFARTAAKAATIWRERAMVTGEASPVINVTKWLPRLTLDVIGEAALNCKFGALENAENELVKVLDNFLADVLYDPSDTDIVFRAIWTYFPRWTFRVLRFIPLSGMRQIRHFLKVAFSVAQSIVDDATAAIANGNPLGKDAMSILIGANHGENPKGKLSNEELLAEMTTLLFAGHETTASTLAWLLHELSRHPDYQLKVRQEIKATRERAASRGSDCLNVNDYDSMSYLVAAIKETLRVHPIALHLLRVSARNDQIPLSTPQHTSTGEVLSSVTVSKGQSIVMSICAYNRLKSLWGEDAHEWRPERYLEGSPGTDASKTGFGLYANLATFSSGVHGCIGWRFALLEMQTIMIELLINFQFAPAGDDIKICEVPAALVTPMVEGKRDQGTQLPLKITPL